MLQGETGFRGENTCSMGWFQVLGLLQSLHLGIVLYMDWPSWVGHSLDSCSKKEQYDVGCCVEGQVLEPQERQERQKRALQ